MIITKKYGGTGTNESDLKGEFQFEKMRYVLDTISESLITLNPDMIVEYANSSACNFFNLEPNQIIGKHCTELYGSEVSPCGYDNHECPLLKDSKKKDLHNSEYESSDGNMWLKKCYSVTSSEGSLTNIAQIFQNITKQLIAEKEKEFIESKLIQAQKMETLGKLVGGVAHDFNNITNTIIGFSDLILLEKKVDNSTLEYIYDIQKSASRATSLTRQLLAFSRKHEAGPQLLDLNNLVKDTVRMLRVLLPENIEQVTNLSKELDLIRVDSAQIMQVIMNLVINARDSTFDGGRITIETENKCLDKLSCKFHRGLVPGDYIVLAVSDTGCGMDEETQARVFEPFFTTKETGKGTGLGLTTVYGIVKQVGGYIYVYSEVDHGTTFRIYFPKAHGKNSTAKDRIEELSTLLGIEKILLVEDDESLRNVIVRILRKLGYKLYQAGSGEEALRIFNSRKDAGIDLLISDIILPDMNGRKLVKNLLGDTNGIKVLYISGYTSDDITTRYGLLNEDVSFLAKPFSIYEIVYRIRSVLDKHNTEEGDV